MSHIPLKSTNPKSPKDQKDIKFKKKPIPTELFPNENIFTDDNYYKLKQDLSFDLQQEDDNCSCDLIYMKLDLMKYTALFLFFKVFFYSVWNFKTYTYFFTFINILNIILVMIIYFQLSQNFEEIKSKYKIIRLFFEIDNLVYLFVTMYEVSEEHLSYYPIYLSFISTLFYNIVFSLSMKKSLNYYLFSFPIILVLHGHDERNFLMRFVSLSINVY